MADFHDTSRGDGLARSRRDVAESGGSPPELPPLQHTLDLSYQPRHLVDFRNLEFDDRPPLRPIDQHAASLPCNQFRVQKHEEMKRSLGGDLSPGWLKLRTRGGEREMFAYGIVRDRWEKQGIWDNKWTHGYFFGKWHEVPDGPWKHEMPLELDTEEEPPSPPFLLKLLRPWEPGQPMSPSEERLRAEKRAFWKRKREREREHQASRPYHQFVYQVSEERERMQKESADLEGTRVADIHTRAYENVKNTWITRCIWNATWGILPGMSWKHEEPFTEEGADDLVPVAVNPLMSSSPEAREDLTEAVQGSPIRNLVSAASDGGDADCSSSTLSPPGPQRQLSTPRDVSTGGPQLRLRGPVKTQKGLRLRRSALEAAMSSKRITRSKSAKKTTSEKAAKRSGKPQGILKRPVAKATRGRGRKEKNNQLDT